MTREEKNLLYKDLCSRLPYNVIVFNTDPDDPTVGFRSMLNAEMVDKLNHVYDSNTYEFRPYLRSMETMTPDEKKVYDLLQVNVSKTKWWLPEDVCPLMDWLNENYFDYRGLIPMGLALEMPEILYKKTTQSEKPVRTGGHMVLDA